MIILIGFGSEVVFAHTVRKFRDEHSVTIVDLEEFIYSPFVAFLDDDSNLLIDGVRQFKIAASAPIYHRFFLRREPDKKVQEQLSDLYRKFVAFCLNRRPGTLLVNHPLASSINTSKVAQNCLMRSFGFETPTTILTTNGAEIQEFCRRFDRPISKGASGVRTMAKRLDLCHVNVAEDIHSVPVLLQEYIDGYDVRLHCLGLTRIALKIETEFVDYRYAERNGFELNTSITTVPPEIGDKCWEYMRHERQEFAAFDFRVRNDKWYLLEVNPMPGYSFFDNLCQGQISAALISLLTQGYSNLYRPLVENSLIPIDRRPQVDIGRPRSTY